MLKETIEKNLSEAYDKTNTQTPNPFRASSSGECARKLAYKKLGFEGEPLNDRAKRVFRLGYIIEKEMTDALPGLESIQAEGKVIIDGQEITCHCDGIYNDCIIDFKSINGLGFKRVQTGFVEPSYISQMHVNMKAFGKRRAVLEFYCKDTSHIHECSIEWVDSIWDEIVERFRKVIKATDSSLPDREHEPKQDGTLPWQCSYCGYCKTCWPDYTMDIVKGKPVFRKETNETQD